MAIVAIVAIAYMFSSSTQPRTTESYSSSYIEEQIQKAVNEIDSGKTENLVGSAVGYTHCAPTMTDGKCCWDEWRGRVVCGLYI
ncbi:MAG: hypothetical protein QXD48_02905 [Candidatus Aenigmatarchaeota archaeon]